MKHIKVYKTMQHEEAQELKDALKKWIKESLKMSSEYGADFIKIHLDVVRLLLKKQGINVKALETAYSATKQ